MRPTCPYCDRKVPKLVPITMDSRGQIVDRACRLCEAEMQQQGFLWRLGSGLDRRPG